VVRATGYPASGLARDTGDEAAPLQFDDHEIEQVLW